MTQVLSDTDSFEVACNQKVHIVRGDLFDERVDVLTNAANSQLSNGGGIARLFREKAGPYYQNHCYYDICQEDRAKVEVGETAFCEPFEL